MELVQPFIGALVLIDAADLGAAAHRVRLFWTNFIKPELLQAALLTGLKPKPNLSQTRSHHYTPSLPRHQDRFPFAAHNKIGETRLCMPTLVSFLRSSAFRSKSDGSPREGQDHAAI